MNEIRSDMETTRTSLAGKLETLQERVTGTVEQAVESVQDAVHTAKRTLDIKYQTQQQPWLAVGLACFAGAVVGYLTSKPRRSSSASEAAHRPRKHAVAGNGRHAERPEPSRSAVSGLFTEEWEKLKGMAVGVGMALARDYLKQAAPGLTEQIEQVMDSATRKLGGVPVEGAPFEPDSLAASRFGGSN